MEEEVGEMGSVLLKIGTSLCREKGAFRLLRRSVSGCVWYKSSRAIIARLTTPVES